MLCQITGGFMKKIILFLCFCFVVSNLYAGTYEYTGNSSAQYKVTDAIKAAWGNPRAPAENPQDKSEGADGFVVKSGWACCGDDPWAVERSRDCRQTNGRPCQDDRSIMAFVAHNITEHGAEFCLTQISASSNDEVFSLLYQEPNWPGLGCHWFCEPGWDGVACMEKTNSDLACDTTNIKNSIDGTKRTDKYGPGANIYDALSLHYKRSGVAEYMAVLDSSLVQNHYPHQIVIGATEFKEHGIVAKPVSIGIVGNHPSVTWVSFSAVPGKTKTLCAQGFTADENCNVSSAHCGSTMWCDASYAGKYNESIHTEQLNSFCKTFVCKDYDKALNEKYECVECKNNGKQGRCNILGKTAFGKCVNCGTGRIFNPNTCECDAARALSQDVMQYGVDPTSVATEQCWTKSDAASYKACVLASDK